MKLNKNGWGTMEMLLLSGGLLIALIVSIFFISKLYGSFDHSIANKNYIDLENRLADAGREYINDYNIEVSGEYKLSLITLKNTGYITDFNDISGNSCNGYVLITNIDSINHYKGYILCNDYQTRNY